MRTNIKHWTHSISFGIYPKNQFEVLFHWYCFYQIILVFSLTKIKYKKCLNPIFRFCSLYFKCYHHFFWTNFPFGWILEFIYPENKLDNNDNNKNKKALQTLQQIMRTKISSFLSLYLHCELAEIIVYMFVFAYCQPISGIGKKRLRGQQNEWVKFSQWYNSERRSK